MPTIEIFRRSQQRTSLLISANARKQLLQGRIEKHHACLFPTQKIGQDKRVFDSSTAQSNYYVRLAAQSLQRRPFSRPELSFAMIAEDPRHALPGGSFDNVVQVNEPPTEQLSRKCAYSRFARPHEPGEKQEREPLPGRGFGSRMDFLAQSTAL